MFTAFLIREHRKGNSTTAFTILAALVVMMGGLLLHALVGHLIPWASFIHRAVPIKDVLAMSFAVCVPVAAILLEAATIIVNVWYHLFVSSVATRWARSH
ncbi:MAG: hypothetical protein Q7R80_01105 [bacterium]|nr:hypothetical protein [bacterium]